MVSINLTHWLTVGRLFKGFRFEFVSLIFIFLFLMVFVLGVLYLAFLFWNNNNNNFIKKNNISDGVISLLDATKDKGGINDGG